MSLYRIADASSYLVKTGAFVDEVKISKKAWVVPFIQRCAEFDVTPISYSFTLNAMSKEKLEFNMPAQFTIGPGTEASSLKKYARLMVDTSGSDHVRDLVLGVLEGEVRVLAASMSMEDIFSERKAFKEKVLETISDELAAFGMIVYNGNIRSLEDSEGSEIFKYLRLKAAQGAVNQAKVDVAEARQMGETGEKERDGNARRRIADIEAQTVIFEQQKAQDIKIAKTELDIKKAELDANVRTAQIEAENKTQLNQAELERGVEQSRIKLETDRQRTRLVAKAQAEAEAAKMAADMHFVDEKRKAEAEEFREQREADALFFAKTKEAEAEQVQAKAKLFVEQKQAEALLYAEQKKSEAKTAEAQALKVLADAQLYQAQQAAKGAVEMAAGIAAIVKAFNNDNAAALHYIMMERGQLSLLAKSNAEAIKGLNPKITVWNTGSDGDASGKAMQPIADVFKTIPPLFSTIHEQSGVVPAKWVADIPTNAKK